MCIKFTIIYIQFISFGSTETRNRKKNENRKTRLRPNLSSALGLECDHMTTMYTQPLVKCPSRLTPGQMESDYSLVIPTLLFFLLFLS